MGIVELLFLAVGLSMDAFAVAVCKGLATPNLKIKHMAIVGAWFGIFQALMPMVGYLLGSAFYVYIEAVSAWVAFVLLCSIGGNMIKEAMQKKEEEADASLAFGKMLLLAIATSIDALAVGITFAALRQQHIVGSVCLIGCVTFLISAAGVKVGSIFGTKYKSKAELCGGIVLILLGIRILLRHFGIWP